MECLFCKNYFELIPKENQQDPFKEACDSCTKYLGKSWETSMLKVAAPNFVKNFGKKNNNDTNGK